MLYVEAVGDKRHGARRRAALGLADQHAGGQAEGRGLVGLRVRLAPVESAVSVRRSAARRCCADCIAASASTRWRRAARRRSRASCWASTAAARARASRIGCPAPVAIDELHLLWRREMVVGSYRPSWVSVRSGDRELVALTFAVRHEHPQYAGKLSLDEQARVIATPRARSARRSTTSSARAWRWSRTASSIPTSKSSRGRYRMLRQCIAGDAPG